MLSSITGTSSDHPGRLPANQRSGQHASPGSASTSQQTQKGSAIRTAADGIEVLRARVGQRLSEFGISSPSAGREFEPPSASEVANRVIGFVENRLQREAENGADTERLSNLLDQARAGVEKGFTEAREQIAALGLLDDRLAADIDESYSRVQDGLAGLTQRFVEGESASATPAADARSVVRVEAAASDRLSFSVRTRDGDLVTVNLQEQSGSRRSGYSTAGEGSVYSATESLSFSAGRYEFSVDGHLDDGERSELTALIKEVQNVSKQFFDGNVQGAFEAAQKLDLGGDQLASFSLNLSAVRSVRASAYSEVARQPSAHDQLRPVAELGQAVRDLGQRSESAGLQLQSLQDLVSRSLESLRSDGVSPENDTEDLKTAFLDSIIETLRGDAKGRTQLRR